MRIHEVEIYTSQEILAFIEYLKVKAEQQKRNEDMQASYGIGCVAGNYAGQGLGALTPEYLAKARAQAVAEANAATPAAPEAA